MCNLYLERFGTSLCGETPMVNDQNGLFQESWNRMRGGSISGKKSLSVDKSEEGTLVHSPEPINGKIQNFKIKSRTFLWLDFSLVAAGALTSGAGVGFELAPFKVLGWSLAGAGLGAGFGHLACGALGVSEKRPFCDLMGGLIGGLASGLLAYHLFKDEFDFDIVVFPTINNENNDNKPPFDPGRRNPIDELGP